MRRRLVGLLAGIDNAADMTLAVAKDDQLLGLIEKTRKLLRIQSVRLARLLLALCKSRCELP